MKKGRADHNNTILNLHGKKKIKNAIHRRHGSNYHRCCEHQQHLHEKHPPPAEAISTARWNRFYCFPLSAVYHRRSDRGRSWSHIKWKLLIMRSIWWADAKRIFTFPQSSKSFWRHASIPPVSTLRRQDELGLQSPDATNQDFVSGDDGLSPGGNHQ